MGIKIQNPFSDYNHSKSRLNDVWAVSSLDSVNPGKQARLTSNFLYIPNKKDHFHKISLFDIKSISLSKKKLLFPLISGSVLSPLVVIAYYNNLINPILFLILFLTGIFLIYAGFQGSYVLTIEEKTIFKKFIQDPIKGLFSFINFCRDFIIERKKEEKVFLFHITPSASSAGRENKIKRLYFYSQIINQKRHLKKKNTDTGILKIDPMKLTGRLQISSSSNGSYTIYTSTINHESIVGEEYL